MQHQDSNTETTDYGLSFLLYFCHLWSAKTLTCKVFTSSVNPVSVGNLCRNCTIWQLYNLAATLTSK